MVPLQLVKIHFSILKQYIKTETFIIYILKDKLYATLHNLNRTEKL